MRESKVGKKIGMLTVVREFLDGKYYMAECKCDCGNSKILHSHSLGKQVSCGCFMRKKIKERFTKHGLSNTKIYKRYTGILQRCTNKNNLHYKNYGGRGIRCEWKNFQEFIDDMGQSYKEGFELDRIDNSGNYSKENCKWVSHTENNRNKRTNVLYEGKCITEWCEELGLNKSTVFVKIFRGKTIKDALGL